MYEFFQMISWFWTELISLVDSYQFGIGSYRVSYFSLVFAGLAICIVISVFWKAGKV